MSEYEVFVGWWPEEEWAGSSRQPEKEGFFGGLNRNGLVGVSSLKRKGTLAGGL